MQGNECAATVDTVDEAVDAMTALAAALPPDDGVACFNTMYLKVTTSVAARLREDTFADPEFMSRLDVNFANLFLTAWSGYSRGHAGAVCRSWRTLFDRRSDARVLPLQFALAGMNAHINHDLPIAVTMTAAELGRPPGAPGVYDDFVAVNAILAEVDDAVRADLQGRVARTLDDVAGPLDDAVASWGIARARAAAWRQSQKLWELRDEAPQRSRFLARLDAVVAIAGRCMLTPVSEGSGTSHRVLPGALAALDGLGAELAETLWGDMDIDGVDDGVLGSMLYRWGLGDDRPRVSGVVHSV